MPHIVVITAVGKDRPGIIAALTHAVLQAQGTLDDATMTRLHGAFATMLAARLPSPEHAAALQETLQKTGATLGLTITVQNVPDTPPDLAPDLGLTVYGADKPGIVHAVAHALGQHSINITDMDTRVAGTPESPLYVMQLEAATGGADLHDTLQTLRQEIGVDITAHDLTPEAL